MAKKGKQKMIKLIQNLAIFFTNKWIIGAILIGATILIIKREAKS